MKIRRRSALLLLAQKYIAGDPASAAHVIENLEAGEAAEILASVPEDQALEAARYLRDATLAPLLPRLPPALALSVLEKIEAPQASAALLRAPAEERQDFLARLSDRRRKQIQEILTYPEGSAGRIMSADFLAFPGGMSVREAAQKIRQQARKGSASYAYVVDGAGRLAGVMNAFDMLTASGDAALEAVMRRDVFSVHCFQDRESVAHEIAKRRFFAAPVVDSDGRLLGIIRAGKLIGDVQEEASEDIQRMFGAGGDEQAFSPMSFSLSKRLPWLYVNLATAFLAGLVVACFEDVIHRITVLAIYLPVVAGQGGNAGAQSLAVVMRGLVMRQIPPQRAAGLIRKETAIGVVNGLAIGAVTAGVSWLWHGNFYLGVVIGLGMLANLVLAGFSGSAIPLGMKALGFDPAQCSNIILTTITDVMGFLLFLGFALLFQSRLA